METKQQTNWESKLAQIQKEIKELKAQIKPHWFDNAEQDYDVKAKIIEKQNRMIEVLIEEGNKLHKELTDIKSNKN